MLEDFKLMDILSDLGYQETDFDDFINTNVTVQVTVVTRVIYSAVTYSIVNVLTFTFTIEDNAPPRVVFVFYEWNDPSVPTNITFYAEIEEYGEGVEELVLYYYFNVVSEENETNGNGALYQWRVKYSQNDEYDYTSVQMVPVNSTHYTTTVDFTPTQNTEIIYKVMVSDKAGNVDDDAYPLGRDPQRIRDQMFVMIIQGLPVELLVGIVFILIIVASILSFIAIKVFGGTELVGLDLEKVMEGIDEPTSEEIQSSIDAHTVGLVISFFDQRHGPVPIIVEPTILKDNFTKLVDLSDLSFSACRFAENFEEELPSNFDFNLGRGYKVTSVAFGFALDRPKARGGSENITLNILAQKAYSKLIIQFTEKFEDQVHDIHTERIG
jgi:hypothetical protein